MDLTKELSKVAKTGMLVYGTEETMRKIQDGTAKLVVYAEKNIGNSVNPIATAQTLNIPLQAFDGTSIQLGAACKRPFPVSMLAILSAGESTILTK